jgi:hypothetical protein
MILAFLSGMNIKRRVITNLVIIARPWGSFRDRACDEARVGRLTVSGHAENFGHHCSNLSCRRYFGTCR